MPVLGSTEEPLRAYNFKLVINGVTEGHFTECSGLGIKVHTIKYREAGQIGGVRSLAGPVEYADVVLRYGLTNSRELWEWLMRSVEGNAERRNVSIIMLDSAGVNEVMRWNLLNAWPNEWHGAPLDALERTVAIETLRLTFDRMERE
jgi:phage tail-like protein